MPDLSDIAVAALWILAMFLSTIASSRLFGSRVAPFGLLCSLWLCSIGLFYVRLIDYEPLQPRTLALFLSSIAMFALGCLVVPLRKLPYNNVHPLRQLDGGSIYRQTAFVLFVLTCVGSGIYYDRLNSLIGISALWDAPQTVRFQETYGDLRRAGLFGLLRSLGVPAVVLSSVCAVAWRPKRWLMLLLAVLSLALILPSSGRTPLVEAMIWSSLSCWYVKRFTASQQVTARGTRRTRTKSLGLLALICLASAAIVVQFIRTTVILNKGVGVDRGGEQMAVAPWVRNIYHYIVAPLPAFQAMERNTAPFEDNGSLTFGAAARVLHELAPSFVKYPDYVQPDVLVPLPVNVYTYLGSFLLDFGIAGVVLIPLSMGAITTAVYSRMRRQPTGLRVYISGLLGLCILSSTGVNRFGTIETAIWILVPVTIVSFLSKVHRVLSVRLRKRSPGYFSGK